MRKILVAGNWKMNASSAMVEGLLDGLLDKHVVLGGQARVVRVCQAADDLDKAVQRKAKADPVARRLMTIPGVGRPPPIWARAGVATRIRSRVHRLDDRMVTPGSETRGEDAELSAKDSVLTSV